MKPLLLAFAILAVISLAFVAGRAFAPVPAALASGPVVVERTLPGPAGLSAAEIRAIVREELATRPATPTAAVPPEPAGDTEASQRALAIVDRALASGRWTEDDRLALSQALPALDVEQADDVFHTLIPAINAGRVRVEFEGPLF